MKNAIAFMAIVLGLGSQSFADGVARLEEFQKNADKVQAEHYAQNVKRFEDFARSRIINWLNAEARYEISIVSSAFQENVELKEPVITIVSEEYKYNPRRDYNSINMDAEVEVIFDYDSYICHAKLEVQSSGRYRIGDSECVSETGRRFDFNSGEYTKFSHYFGYKNKFQGRD